MGLEASGRSRLEIRMSTRPDTNPAANIQQDVLKRLGAVIIENQDDLENAVHTGRINAVAWLTRNLLELMIWTLYCAKSEENAQQFLLDAGRDLTDTLRTLSKIVPDPTAPKAALKEIIEWANEVGVETLEERFTAVSKAAEEIGKAGAFRDVNKLLSKFAHPTAL
jgi:hypothetical protein